MTEPSPERTAVPPPAHAIGGMAGAQACGLWPIRMGGGGALHWGVGRGGGGLSECLCFCALLQKVAETGPFTALDKLLFPSCDLHVRRVVLTPPQTSNNTRGHSQGGGVRAGNAYVTSRAVGPGRGRGRSAPHRCGRRRAAQCGGAPGGPGRAAETLGGCLRGVETQHCPQIHFQPPVTARPPTVSHPLRPLGNRSGIAPIAVVFFGAQPLCQRGSGRRYAAARCHSAVVWSAVGSVITQGCSGGAAAHCNGAVVSASPLPHCVRVCGVGCCCCGC